MITIHTGAHKYRKACSTYGLLYTITILILVCMWMHLCMCVFHILVYILKATMLRTGVQVSDKVNTTQTHGLTLATSGRQHCVPSSPLFLSLAPPFLKA